jgi:hypothetical protein
MEGKLMQFANARSPMLLTLCGIVTDVRLEQFSNAFRSMATTPFLIITDVKPEA